ncbi:MAG: pilus assembly protein PilM [Planctomycetota bacterium]
MIGWNLARNTPPIGVDVGRQSVKLVQRGRAGADGTAKIIATGRQPLPSGLSPQDEGYHQWVGSAVKAALDRGDFVGRRCVSALPSCCVTVKNLRLPKMPADELREAVNWELRDRLESDADVLVQFLRAGEVRQGEDVREELIAMATETPFVEGHVDALCEAGLAPLAVEVSVTALARAFGERCAEGVHVLLDVGFESSKLLILRDGAVTFFKRIDVGGQVFDDAVANHLDMSTQDASKLRRDFEVDASGVDRSNPSQRALYEALRGPVTELSQEIELCLRYFGVTFRGTRPDRMMLVGGEAIQSWLGVLLAEQSGFEVALGDVTGGKAGGSAPGWAVAAGLSMRSESGWGERRQGRSREGRAAA